MRTISPTRSPVSGAALLNRISSRSPISKPHSSTTPLHASWQAGFFQALFNWRDCLTPQKRTTPLSMSIERSNNQVASLEIGIPCLYRYMETASENSSAPSSGFIISNTVRISLELRCTNKGSLSEKTSTTVRPSNSASVATMSSTHIASRVTSSSLAQTSATLLHLDLSDDTITPLNAHDETTK